MNLLPNSSCNRLRAFRSAQGGNVSIIFGLAMIPAVALLGAAVDYTRANSAKARLQSAADSAALLGAAGSFSSDSGRSNGALNAFLANYQGSYGDATPTATIANNIITISATGNMPTAFMGIAGFKTIPVNVTAVAGIGGGSTACLLALQSTNDGIFVHGSASLKANCGLYANSTGNNAIDFDGDSVTTATSMCVVGNYTADPAAKVNPRPTTRCPAMADPLATLPVPGNAAASCTYNGYELDGTGTLNPGVYCGGIEIGSGAKATFNPGTYIIRDGRFKIGSSAQVTGQNVFFYLTGTDANLDQGSSSHMNFTAPDSGTYKGILFFQSRTANTSENRFGGSSTDVIQGTVYFPNGTAEINCNGSVGASADYTVWVVKRLQIDSNANLVVTSNYAGSATPLPDAVASMVIGPKVVLTQ